MVTNVGRSLIGGLAVVAVAGIVTYAAVTNLAPHSTPGASAPSLSPVKSSRSAMPASNASRRPTPTRSAARLASCSLSQLAIAPEYRAGGAAGNWAQTFKVKNRGNSCSLAAASIVISGRPSRVGSPPSVSTVTIRAGDSVVYVLAPNECADGTINIRSKNATAPVMLILNKNSRQIGKFPELYCSDAFIDQ